MLKRLLLAFVLVTGFVGVTHAQDTQPAVIAVTDGEAIKARMGQTVAVEGQVDKAEWSKSGKVLNVNFKNLPQGLLVVVFEKHKDKFNAAFDNDAAAAWTGAKVRVTGKVEEYGGKDEKMKGRPQIILQNPEQVVVVEKAAK